MPTIKESLLRAEELQAVSESARIDVEVMLSWVIGKDRSYLFTWPERALTTEQQQLYELCLTRRKNGEPVAHIIGTKEFWSLPLLCDNSTLIPRPDTEVLVEVALSLLPSRPSKILDLGTGTGAIALALASERSDCHVVAVDVVEAAVNLTKKNSAHLDLRNVEVKQSSWFDNVDEKFDVIVSNPPYIDETDEHLGMGDVRFEPRSALVAQENGLADIRIIAEHSAKFLEQQGWLILEHGWKQKYEVQSILASCGYVNIETKQDYAGNDRVTLGQFNA